MACNCHVQVYMKNFNGCNIAKATRCRKLDSVIYCSSIFSKLGSRNGSPKASPSNRNDDDVHGLGNEFGATTKAAVRGFEVQ